ncbi:MAG TPA: hypothetical protein VF132_01585 [Rudaea sp.]
MSAMSPQLTLIAWFLLPLWLLVGIADWLCHRATDIEHTTGAKESMIHLLLFAEVGIPLLGALFFEVNALILLALIAGFLLHEATSLWDVSYAVKRRRVTPFEQHVHSFLEMIPLMLILLFGSDHWDQFRALVGAGPATADFSLRWNPAPLPVAYFATLLVLIALVELAPYLEELWRGLRANRGAWVPANARRHPQRDQGFPRPPAMP